jgi:hypothetical protein
MGFDIEAARRDGYSEADIVDHLARTRNFDAAKARRDGHTDTDLLTHLREQLKPERGAVESIARGVGSFVGGATERAGEVLGAIPDLYNSGLRAVGLPAMAPGAYTRGIQRVLDPLQAAPVPETTTERALHGAGSGLVDAATTMIPAAAVARGAAVGSTTARVAGQLAAQPALQVASGVAGGAVGEATESPLLGAATALALPLGAAAGARAITPVQNALSPEHQRLVGVAGQLGIRTSAGQATGSPFLKNIESRFAQAPGSGRVATAFTDAQRGDVTAASLRFGGENSRTATPDVLNAGLARAGGEIGDIANRNTMQVTPALEARLAEIEDGLQFIAAETAAPIRARLEQVRGMMQPDAANGGGLIVPGAAYRQLDTAITKSANDAGDGDRRTALRGVREALRTAMDNSISPDDATDWARARREYANLKVTEKAMGTSGEATARGYVPPAALKNAVNQSTGNGFARGFGDQNDLARLGQDVLRLPPDSGTAGHTLANSIVTGQSAAVGGIGAVAGGLVAGPVGATVGGLVGPLVIPRAVQMAYNNPLMQAYLRNQALPPDALAAIRQWRTNALLQQGVSGMVGDLPEAELPPVHVTGTRPRAD